MSASTHRHQWAPNSKFREVHTYSSGWLSTAGVGPVDFRRELAGEGSEEHPLDVVSIVWCIGCRVLTGDHECVRVACGRPLGREVPLRVNPGARDGVGDIVVLACMRVMLKWI